MKIVLWDFKNNCKKPEEIIFKLDELSDFYGVKKPLVGTMRLADGFRNLYDGKRCIGWIYIDAVSFGKHFSL